MASRGAHPVACRHFFAALNFRLEVDTSKLTLEDIDQHLDREEQRQQKLKAEFAALEEAKRRERMREQVPQNETTGKSRI